MSQEDISALCYIRSRLGDLKQIKIVSEEIKILDEALLTLFCCLFWKNDSLTQISLKSCAYGEFDESILYLAEKVLPTMSNLKDFYLHFEKGYVSSQVCESLSQILSQQVQNLSSLHLVFQSNDESSLKKLFVSMPNLEFFEYQISCAGATVLDKKFISDTLPSLKKLKSFQFFINSPELSNYDLKKLLSSFPEEWFLTLNHFRLDLSNTQANDESLTRFVKITMKKFKALQTFAINTTASKVSLEMKKIISEWKKISNKLSSI